MEGLMKSLQKNKTGMCIMVLSAMCSSFGQYFWKISVSAGGHSIAPLLFGFVLYGAGAAFMVAAFRFGSFSVLHPMQSLSYIFALLIGYFLLSEAITPQKMIGIALIFCGVAMIGAGDE